MFMVVLNSNVQSVDGHKTFLSTRKYPIYCYLVALCTRLFDGHTVNSSVTC